MARLPGYTSHGSSLHLAAGSWLLTVEAPGHPWGPKLLIAIQLLMTKLSTPRCTHNNFKHKEIDEIMIEPSCQHNIKVKLFLEGIWWLERIKLGPLIDISCNTKLGCEVKNNQTQMLISCNRKNLPDQGTIDRKLISMNTGLENWTCWFRSGH